MSLLIQTARYDVIGRPPYDRPRPYVLEPGITLIESEGARVTSEEARRESRKAKILIGEPTTPLLWLDASLRPKPGLLAHVEKWLEHHELAIFTHPWRDCAYDEADECVRRKKLDQRLANEIKSTLALNSLPKHWGLWSCGAIAWKTECRRLRDAWWHWAQATGMRDQIALPLALRESGYRDKLFTVQGSIYDFFDWVPHGR
jgi:hypothetical protein